MTQKELDSLLCEQFAIDYGCTAADFQRRDTLVTELSAAPQTRRRSEPGILSMLSYKGKLVIAAAPQLLDWSRSVLAAHCSAEWGFEAGALLSIDRKLREYGFAIDQAHLFFAPQLPVCAAAHPTQLLHKEDIARLEADERIDEAFLFEEFIEDVLGCAVYGSDGALLAVAGATANSDRMWEMGVNSFAEGRGYAVSAVAALTQEILQQGKVPFYGTALSHLASQNVALRAGLVPAFCELTTKQMR